MLQPIPQNPIVGYAELARITGLSARACSVRACHGELPFQKLRIGSNVAFDRAEVMAWVEAKAEA